MVVLYDQIETLQQESLEQKNKIEDLHRHIQHLHEQSQVQIQESRELMQLHMNKLLRAIHDKRDMQ